MKMPITWHEENYRNARAHLERERLSLEKHKQYVQTLSNDISDRRKQLERANRENRDGFDAERYQPR